MNIRNLDNERLLWHVNDIVSQEQLNDILSIDWLNIPWARGMGQESWPRRLLDDDHTDVKRATSYIRNRLKDINNWLQTNFDFMYISWWLDEPGFVVYPHTDGELPATMQLYWVAPGIDYGTCFYFDKIGTVKHHFQSVPNTGYLMLNTADSTGYRILQWHGMMNSVPPNTWRLSTYVSFISTTPGHHDAQGLVYNS